MTLVYVVVTGPPASGKSTLSRHLAQALGLPRLVKDDIKQRLLDEHPAADVVDSRETGRAAVRELLERAAEAGSGVLDSVWVDRATATERLTRLGDVVEVHCRCDLETLRRRYVERAPTRPRGHFDEERSDDELWRTELRRPLAGGWPVGDVDTPAPVDGPALAERVTPATAGRLSRRRSRR